MTVTVDGREPDEIARDADGNVTSVTWAGLRDYGTICLRSDPLVALAAPNALAAGATFTVTAN